MVINNNPSYAYLLEGNSPHRPEARHGARVRARRLLQEQLLLPARPISTPAGRTVDPVKRPSELRPEPHAGSTRWPTTARVIRRIVERHGINKVEEFIDHCLSLENLIDPWTRRSVGGGRKRDTDDEEPRRRRGAAPPREGLHGVLHQPRASTSRSRRRRSRPSARRRSKFPEHPERDVLLVPARARAARALGARRPRGRSATRPTTSCRRWQTKIMNEGWATYWHSQAHDREGPAMRARSSTTPTTTRASWRRAAAGSTRTSSASSSTATSRSAGTRASSARSGRSATTSTRRRTGTCASASGKKKIFEVRALYNDVTFIDEFLTPEFVDRAEALHASAGRTATSATRSRRASSAR